MSSEDALDDLIDILNGCRDAFYTEGEWIWHGVHQEGEPPNVNLHLSITYFYHGDFKEVRASELFVDEENGCALFLVMWDWNDLGKQLEVMLEKYPTNVAIYTTRERVSNETKGRAIFLKGIPADRHSGESWEKMQRCFTITLEEEEESEGSKS